MKKIALLSILAIITMSACDKVSKLGNDTTTPTVACGSPDANSAMEELIRKQLERDVVKAFDDNGLKNNLINITSTQINTMLNRIKISLDDFRTTEKTDKSSELQCKATLRLEIPNDIIQNATETHKAHRNKNSVDFFESEYHLESGFYTRTISYSVQLTDNKAKIFVSLNQANATTDPISALISYALLKEPIDNANKIIAEHQQQTTVQSNETQSVQNTLDQEKTEASIKEWTERHKVALNDINTYWDNLPKLVQDKLMPTQKAWNESFQKSCAALAKSDFPDNPKEEQVSLLACKTNYIEERLEELKEQHEKMLPALINDANKKSETAKSRLETALQNVPQDIMSQIQDDYNHWSVNVENKCQKENDTHHLAQNTCMAEEMNKKAKELEDYSIQ